MKNVLTVFVFIFATTLFAQKSNLKGNVTLNDVKIEEFKIKVEVDSAEEIESTFTVDDFKDLLNQTDKDEALVFKIICNSKSNTGNKTNVSYEVKGNTNNKRAFLNSIKKVRKAAIKYYTSK